MSELFKTCTARRYSQVSTIGPTGRLTDPTGDRSDRFLRRNICNFVWPVGPTGPTDLSTNLWLQKTATGTARVDRSRNQRNIWKPFRPVGPTGRPKTESSWAKSSLWNPVEPCSEAQENVPTGLGPTGSVRLVRALLKCIRPSVSLMTTPTCRSDCRTSHNCSTAAISPIRPVSPTGRSWSSFAFAAWVFFKSLLLLLSSFALYCFFRQ